MHSMCRQQSLTDINYFLIYVILLCLTLLGIEIVDEMDQVTDMQEFAKDENKRLQRL